MGILIGTAVPGIITFAWFVYRYNESNQLGHPFLSRNSLNVRAAYITSFVISFVLMYANLSDPDTMEFCKHMHDKETCNSFLSGDPTTCVAPKLRHNCTWTEITYQPNVDELLAD